MRYSHVDGFFSTITDMVTQFIGARSARSNSTAEVQIEQARTAQKEANVKLAATVGGVAVAGLAVLAFMPRKKK